MRTGIVHACPEDAIAIEIVNIAQGRREFLVFAGIFLLSGPLLLELERYRHAKWNGVVNKWRRKHPHELKDGPSSSETLVHLATKYSTEPGSAIRRYLRGDNDVANGK
jgi:hypothetical protein